MTLESKLISKIVDFLAQRIYRQFLLRCKLFAKYGDRSEFKPNSELTIVPLLNCTRHSFP